MVDNSNGGSGIRKGRRGGKKRSGGNEGRVEDTGGSNDGPQQQTKQLKQQQSFPVVADPRFASMHSAPVSFICAPIFIDVPWKHH